MKKLLCVLLVVLISSMSFTIFANAEGTAWETSQVYIDDLTSPTSANNNTTSSNESANTKTTAAKVSITKCSVSNIKNKTYTGKKLSQSPTVKYGKKTLKKDTDYTLSYTNNIKIGTATVTIKGKGNYTGSVKKSFKIVPKGTSITKITKPKSKQLKVYYKKQATQTTGYQVQIATKSDFSKNRKTYYVKSNKTTNKLITKLAAGKKYYVRVRTYKAVGKTNYYSSWSAAKAVTLS